MQKLSLTALQRQFREVLKLAEALTPVDEKASPVVKLINTNESFGRQERLGVYQYAYLSRLVESMQEDFPALQGCLGEKTFVKLVEGYLEKYPSKSWTLAELGLKFSEFITSTKAEKIIFGNKRVALKEELLFLRDIAKLEFIKIIVFLLEAPEVFDFRVLASVDPKVLLASQIILNPTLRILRSRWFVDQVVENEGRDFKIRDIKNLGDPESVLLAVFRSHEGVQTYRVNHGAAPVFLAISRGASIGQILETVVKKKIEASTVFSLFSDWSTRGLITGFKKQDARTRSHL